MKVKGQNESSWEQKDNLDCSDLIAAFESNEKKKKEFLADVKKRKSSDTTVSDGTTKKGGGFDRGLIAERIIGATETSGELMFLMKWKDTEEADLVSAKQANVAFPQVVIQFYEERMTWHSSLQATN